MPEDTSGSNPTPAPGESPGGKPMGAWGIALVTIYLVVVTIVVFHSLIVLWPPNRDTQNKDLDDRLARIEKALGVEETPAATPAPAAQSTPATLNTDFLGSDMTSDLPGSDFTSSTETTTMGTGMTAGGEAGEEDSEALRCRKLDGKQLSAQLFWMKFCLSDEER